MCPWGLKESDTIDLGSIPGSGRSPGEGNGKPLQYSCLESPTDRGAMCPWGLKESDTIERLHFLSDRFLLIGESSNSRLASLEYASSDSSSDSSSYQ